MLRSVSHCIHCGETRSEQLADSDSLGRCGGPTININRRTSALCERHRPLEGLPVVSQPLRKQILRLYIPGIIPGRYPEYPDQLSGGFVTVTVAMLLSCFAPASVGRRRLRRGTWPCCSPSADTWARGWRGWVMQEASRSIAFNRSTRSIEIQASLIDRRAFVH